VYTENERLKWNAYQIKMSKGENVRCIEGGKVLTWHSSACDNTALISGTDAIPKANILLKNPHVRICGERI
jgi:hypothetical protein